MTVVTSLGVPKQLFFKVLTMAENWHAKCLTKVASLFKPSEKRFALRELMMIATNNVVTGFDATKALVISASAENRAALSDALSANGFVAVPCGSMNEARKFIRCDDIGIVFCDDCLSDGCLRNVVAEVGRRQRPIPVIAVSRTGEWDEYFEAFRMGAFDYLSLPPRRDELDRILASALGGTERLSNRVKAEAAT